MAEPRCDGVSQDCLLHVNSLCAAASRVKVEVGEGLSSSQTSELYFLRSRVRQLEKEKSDMSAENQRLRNMLVNEIPGLLSTMWQTLGQANHQVSMATSRGDDYILYPHHDLSANHSAQDGAFSPPSHTHSLPLGPEDLSGDMSDYGAPLGSSEEEAVGGEMPPYSHMEQELRRRDGNHVEVYPGSGVLCDLRSWHAANQAQSSTAMARTLLLGVFDMETLMSSNLRGGRSRRPAFHQQRSALDPHKISAIFNATLARFPHARKGVIGTGINSKLSEIRFRLRRANREPRFM